MSEPIVQEINQHSFAGDDAARRGRGRPALDGEAQREKILAVASKLFIDKGFSETTLDAISKAAHVTKRTIYLHIGDKAELFRVVCKEYLPLAGQLQFTIHVEGRSLDDIVTAMARQLLLHSLAPEAIALERVLTIESLRFPKLVQEVVDDSMFVLNRNIAAVFEELVRRGELPQLDSARAADFFYDTIIGNRGFRMTMGHSEPPPDDEELAQRVDMFVHGHLMRLPGRRASGKAARTPAQ
jgi:AcrR family transcriptional regulator